MKKGSGIFFDLIAKEPTFYLEHFDHLEIQDFAFPDNLDFHGDTLVVQYRKLLSDFHGTLSLHGPYKEMISSSMDREVQNLARRRFTQALHFGQALGCERMVLHSCYNPLMRYPEYPSSWLKNMISFWDDFLPYCQAHEMAIVLENVWDPNPDHILDLLRHFRNPGFGACLDTGHAHIFSHDTIDRWIEALGEHLVHLHIHDNRGEEDEHLPPGRGNIDFSGLQRLINCPNTVLVSEVFGFIEEGKSYLDFLRAMDKQI